MEQEAFRRAREMHSHSPLPQNPQRAEPPAQKKPDTPIPPSSKEKKSVNADFRGVASPLFADKEKLLILALILVLSAEERSDPSLTLALLYLII